MVNGQCFTTMVTTSWWSSGQDMGFGGLGMANSKSDDYNLFLAKQSTRYVASRVAPIGAQQTLF